MKNSFKYFNNPIEKVPDKSPTPSKSPLKIMSSGIDSKATTLANTASLEERIKSGSFQNKVMSQMGLREINQNQTFKPQYEGLKTGLLVNEKEEVFKLKKEIMDFREREKRYMGKILELEKENGRLVDLIRQNEREFKEKMGQNQSERQEIIKRYNDLKLNHEQNLLKIDRKTDEDSDFVMKLVVELNNKMAEIEKNAVQAIKERKIGKENGGDENMLKANEAWVRKCKEMEFVIFHLHNENKHLKQYISCYWEHKQEENENVENPEIVNLPLPSNLKIIELAKKANR